MIAYGRAVRLRYTSIGEIASSTAHATPTPRDVHARASHGASATSAMPAMTMGARMAHSVMPTVS